MTVWDRHYAGRAVRLVASEIRELLKLTERPDIISFAGGIPEPRLFPAAALADGAREVALATLAGRTEGSGPHN
jgi:DNA-binding transcriptional MocR family regulator